MKRSPLVRKTPLVYAKPLASGIRTSTSITPSAPKLAAKPKMRKCAICRTPFIVRDMMRHKWCSEDCGTALGLKLLAAKKAKADRAERKRLAELKAATKPLQARLKLAEKAVNRYVRARDHFLGCCSCDKGAHWDGQWHASHFKSVGSNSRLRFNLWNINKGCSQCNHHQGGNIPGYEPRLIVKIGAERVEWLKCQNGITKYTPDYLDRLTRVMNKKARRAEKRIAAIG